MGLRSRLSIKHKGASILAVFYLAAAIVNFIILGAYGLGLFHVGLIGVLSLLASFGIYQLQKWSLWLVAALFFITTTYSAFMLFFSWMLYTSNSSLTNLFGVIAWIAYLLSTWAATAYLVAKRENLH